ncbi:SGNH/GDSL hydrolase family protein [Amphibacillus cookii]|uniref:SGNH/GDSL hydrolase family protein n=1 Tax=Amphibacillus cookii TaxID=767787 RepID=UPI0019582767|nr:SGNH/GDSL hydrolase family protein [Amphibacillus cookii]MBM7540045.1 lysophospholipase L1-like esterase [Amphibacillus cookii]
MSDHAKYLFIGDSITEWGRFEDSEGLGDNYVRMIRDDLAIHLPYSFPEFINRGIGGNRITDLVERWQTDVIANQPDLVSISIGINDVWRQLDNSDMEHVYPSDYAKLYRELIEQTRAQKIVLMEPTIIDEDPQSKGNQLLKPYVEIVNQLADEYQLTVVPTHQAFLNYLHRSGPLPLTVDGVHMSSTGNRLMAQTWLQALAK